MFLLAMFCILVVTGCTSVKNKPFGLLPPVAINPAPDAGSVSVAICTRFGPGTDLRHMKRADGISNNLVQYLRANCASRGVQFSTLRQFDKPENVSYDFLLQLKCKRPEQRIDRNNVLMAICWPATLSIIFTPIGILGLSIHGMVREYTDFEWSLELVPKHYEAVLRLQCEELPKMTAKVSATGWGTPEDKLDRSYENVDSHVKGAAVDFVNTIDWAACRSQVEEYAANHALKTTTSADRSTSQDAGSSVRIAVWQLKAETGVDASITAVLTDSIRDTLLKSKRFTVVARDEMEGVMKEQDVALTEVCDTTACAVEYGQSLSVEKFVIGTAAQLDDMYQISLQLINVESGEIERSGKARNRGTKSVLFELADKAAEDLLK